VAWLLYVMKNKNQNDEKSILLFSTINQSEPSRIIQLQRGREKALPPRNSQQKRTWSDYWRIRTMVGSILEAAKKIITHLACLSDNPRCVLLTVFSAFFSFPNGHRGEGPEDGPNFHAISCSFDGILCDYFLREPQAVRPGPFLYRIEREICKKAPLS
jgi:hypothetical protein